MIEATRTRRYDFDAGSTFSDTVAITATDQTDNLAGLPLQVIRDTTSPTVSLTVPSSGTLRFGVSWTGVDTEAGIRRFELEYRTKSGSWTRLRPGVLHRPAGRVFTTGYTYDSLDRLQTMTYPDGEVVTTLYNGRGLPQTISGEKPGEFFSSYLSQATYNGPGLPTQWGLGGVVTQTIDNWHNPLQPQHLHSWNTAGNLRELTFEFDSLGRLDDYTNSTIIIDTGGEGGDDGPLNYIYDYDALNRLVAIDSNVTSSEYGYDALGNLITRDAYKLVYATTPGTLPHALQRVEERFGAEPATLAEFDYDPNGNMITKTVDSLIVSYTYDAENRLARIISDTHTTVLTATFLYDGDGQLVRHTTQSGGQDQASFLRRGALPAFGTGGNQRRLGREPASLWRNRQ